MKADTSSFSGWVKKLHKVLLSQAPPPNMLFFAFLPARLFLIVTVGAYHLAKNSRILGKKSNGTATFEKFRLEIRVTSKGTPFFPFVTGSFKIVYHLLSSLVSSLLCRSCSLFNMGASMYQCSFCNAASTGLEKLLNNECQETSADKCSIN